MSKTKYIFLFLSLLIVSLPSFANSIFKIQHWVTKNGAKVYFVEAPEIPMVDVQVVFHAGSAYDGDKWGLASLTNNMVGQATITQDANEIARDFDNVGAQFDSDITRDMSYFSLRSLTEKKYLQPAINTFTSALTQAVFLQPTIERLKNETMAAIGISQQTPGGVAEELFYSSLYKNAPYAHPIIGITKTVNAFTSQEINAFYKKFYVAKNADVIMVGALTLQQAKHIADSITENLPQGEAAKEIPLVIASNDGLIRHQNFPSKQTSIMVGQVGINRQSKNYFPLIVGNFILGGSPMTSLLFDNIREKHGLAYAAYSYFLPLSARGPFVINLNTRANKAEDALKLVQETLEQFVLNGPTTADLVAAKQNLIGGFVLNLSTNHDISTAVRNIAFYNRSLDYLDHYQARVKAVTVEQIRDAFRKEIKPSQMIIVTVGPQAATVGQKMVQ